MTLSETDAKLEQLENETSRQCDLLDVYRKYNNIELELEAKLLIKSMIAEHTELLARMLKGEFK